MGISIESLSVNGNNSLSEGNSQQELFSMNTNSSLLEDVECRGGGVDEAEDESSENSAPTLEFEITDELKDALAEAIEDEVVLEPVAVENPPPIAEREINGSWACLCLLAVFALSIASLVYVYANFPKLEESEKAKIKVPMNIEEAKVLGEILSRYRDKYYYSVIGGIFAVYIFLQTFAIPGSIFLSIMSGFLFSFPVAMFLICFCSATGASFCYTLSYLLGRKFIYKCFPERAESWARRVDSHRDNLLSYIIFLRITPFLPNWFINIASPVLNVPLVPFWFGTFIGVCPPSFVAIQAGTTLQNMTSSSDAVSWSSLIGLIALGFLSLLPVLFKNKLKSKFE